MDYFLGLDLGTTNCKVVAVNRQGQIAASASAPTPVQKSTDPGIVEYDAKMLWKVSARLIRQVIEKLGPGQNMAGLAVASIGESAMIAVMNPLSTLVNPRKPLFTLSPSS